VNTNDQLSGLFDNQIETKFVQLDKEFDYYKTFDENDYLQNEKLVLRRL